MVNGNIKKRIANGNGKKLSGVHLRSDNKNNSEREELKKYLQKIEDPKYNGADVFCFLPPNATPLEKVKYEVCNRILTYQQSNNLTDEELAQKIHLTTGEVREILYHHINYFMLDRLVTYATQLSIPLELK